MTIDQLESIGEEIAHVVKARYTLDYVRFDAGVGALEQTVPWAVLFISKRGYENRTNPEFPIHCVQKWLSMTEAEARDAITAIFESRAKGLMQPAVEVQQTETLHKLQPTL